MKITTWNVNGIRAVISRNGFNWIQKIDPDILCLQEIKADQTQIDLTYIEDLSEYHAYWNPAVKKGYSGDFNTAHQEIDLKNPKQNLNTSGFLRIERDYIDALLQENLLDIYRKKYPEKEEYTWWTYRAKARERNIGWRLDYFLISAKLERRVIDIIIHTDIYGSDHCPVTLILED